MSRKIKFRAWDRKRMAEVCDMSFVEGELLSVSTRPNGDDEAVMQVMQFTGLTDKNGKEIYEGDVVLIPDEQTQPILDDGSGPREPLNHLAEVFFEDGCFRFRVFESADILEKGSYTWEYLKDGTGIDEVEIIGNIYSNPDLLGKEWLGEGKDGTTL